jgi:hypothetical protein
MGKNNWYSTILIRAEAGKTKIALEGLKKLCKELNPAFPFGYKFSDEEYANLYKSDVVIGNLSAIFAVLGIFISCLGLLGLSILPLPAGREIESEKCWVRALHPLRFIVEGISCTRNYCIRDCSTARMVGNGSLAFRLRLSQFNPWWYSAFPVCWPY